MSQIFDQFLKIVIPAALDKKGSDISVINLENQSSFADGMVIISGTSNRHIHTLATSIQKELSLKGIISRLEGLTSCDWVLVDSSDGIVHIFKPDIREFYNIEGMWSSFVTKINPDDYEQKNNILSGDE
ncbi:MAG: ribosome silencing factor [Candidatus Puniceispirillum sp.]|nr:ribosome silencing factor [Candidatus Pelagibacter sp.]MBA4283020.1 ribosome silencing factor [Candidatus Puniceispirillum sp.]